VKPLQDFLPGRIQVGGSGPRAAKGFKEGLQRRVVEVAGVRLESDLLIFPGLTP